MLWWLLFFFSFQVFSFFIYNRSLPDCFIDEFYHIPQAQKYLKGNFRHWNPMITTPPGLYVLAFLALSPLKLVIQVSNVHFRLVNWTLSLCLPFLFDEIKVGMLVVMTPIVHPYCNLFYTDVGSLFMVLLSKRLIETNHDYYAAIVKIFLNKSAWHYRLVCVLFYSAKQI